MKVDGEAVHVECAPVNSPEGFKVRPGAQGAHAVTWANQDVPRLQRAQRVHALHKRQAVTSGYASQHHHSRKQHNLT